MHAITWLPSAVTNARSVGWPMKSEVVGSASPRLVVTKGELVKQCKSVGFK